MQWPKFLVVLLATSLVGTALASERNHRYKDNEPVVLWVNKVGPFNNPQETYNYYALPYCKARPNERAAHSWGGLGEVLQGNELIHSQLDIRFKGADPFMCHGLAGWRCGSLACLLLQALDGRHPGHLHAGRPHAWATACSFPNTHACDARSTLVQWICVQPTVPLT